MGNALKSIKRMRLMSALIVIQLAISLAMVNRTGSITEGYVNKINGFTRAIGEEKNYIIKVFDPILANMMQNGMETDLRNHELLYTISDFRNKLEALKQEGVIKNIFYNHTIPSRIDYKKLLSKEVVNNKDLAQVPGIFSDESFSTILVNYDFINHYKLPIYEGRGFTKEDFNIDYRKEPIPIILGKGYKENVKIGDVLEIREYFSKYLLDNTTIDDIEKYLDKNGRLEYTDVNLKLKVIGFYDDNGVPAMFSDEEIIKNVGFSNTYSIIPCVKGIASLNEIIIGYDLGAYIEVRSMDDLKRIKTKLEPDLKEKGLELQTIDLNEEVLKIKEVMARDIINSGLLGVVLMILSIVGITSVLLGEVNERKREFGIRIGSGATISTLCKEMILEIMIMVIMAALLSILLIFRNGNSISMNLMMINIGVMGIITLIISIIPIMRLRKMNPVDLVRGK